MARDLNLLEPEFQEKARKLLDMCEDAGVIMKPFYTLRSVYDQAKLWRQSRNTPEIQGAINWLNDNGAPWLASVLKDVGPTSGPWATNALPGFSWHQHGEAIDCYWEVKGEAVWDTLKFINGVNGYSVYSNNAVNLGLDPGHLWKSRDSVHVQKTDWSINKLIDDGHWTLKQLDDKMRGMFDV